MKVRHKIHRFRFGVFAYDFPHWKTQTGLFNLFVHGLIPEVVLAAPRKELNIKASKRRVTPRDLFLVHPREVCKAFGFPYRVAEHDGDAAFKEITRRKLEFGVILGARILKPKTIGAFRGGVINLHPGILPDNRGLDNLKWALIDNIPQGVTAHFIDGHVDRGRILMQKTIPIYQDDTLLDLFIRLQNLEQSMMVDVLCGFAQAEVAEGIGPRACVPPEVDEQIDMFLDAYKEVNAKC